ncbi:O-antigen ligase family protein [Edwardsiella tarda]|uniref:O-antigen ligase family protein n=1 Tax=Edwardsiella tarda TaxID=636 RepID=UPI00351BF168
MEKYKKISSSYAPIFYAFLISSLSFCGYSSVNILFYISMGCFFIHVIINSEKYNFPIEFILLAIVLSYFSMTLLWSSYSNNFLKYIKYSIYIITFIYISSCLYKINSRLFLHCLLIASTLSSIIALWHINNLSQISEVRLASPYGPENVIDFAGYSGIGFLVGLYFTLNSNVKMTIFYASIASISLAACILTQSRGPILYVVICSLFLIRKKNIKSALTLAIVISIIILGLSVMHLFNPADLVSRFSSINTELNGTQGFRGAIWKFAILKSLTMPFFGHGILTPLNYLTPQNIYFTTTHSTYIGALYTGGIVGLILFIMLCIKVFSLGIKFFKKDPLPMVLFIYALLHISTQWRFLIMNSDAPWFIFWMPLALILSTVVMRGKA